MWRAIEAGLMTEKRMYLPHVGAIVITKDGEIVGRGCKKFIPNTKMILHAERVALDEARDKARGSILVTTLEPCYRNGIDKKSHILCSCSELIIERGIETVIYNSEDDSTKFKGGQGIKKLTDAGINTLKFDSLDQYIQKYFDRIKPKFNKTL